MNYITYIKNGGYYFTICIPRLLFAWLSESRFRRVGNDAAAGLEEVAADQLLVASI
jgi:hypothetical protein